MSRFYLDDADPSSLAGSDDETDLPFPAPLSRATFSTPSDFSPAEFLTTLSSRHQTLEDLREELRGLSSSLSNELLDLVNENYSDFLGLGKQLRGGDERVEEVRVGLLGFQREIEGLQKGVISRREEMKTAIEEKRQIGREIAIGRRLLEIEERLTELEHRLLIRGSQNGKGHENGKKPHDDDWDSEVDDIDTDDADSTDDEDTESAVEAESKVIGSDIRRLRRHVNLYQIVKNLMTLYGEDHPFIQAQQGRTEKIRSSLGFDLQNLQKQASATDGDKVAQELATLESSLKNGNDSREIPIRRLEI